MTREKFISLIVPQHRCMFRLALVLCGNEADAADLVQDTMMRLWERRHTFDDLDTPGGYCCRALRNRYMDRCRLTTAEHTQLAENCLATSDDVMMWAECSSQLSLVHNLIDRLPPAQREVIRLSSAGGYSNVEIAAMTGLSDVNVRSLLSRARKKLKEMMSIYDTD